MDLGSLTVQLASWANQLRYEDIPPETLCFARSQLISNLATVRASLHHPLGHNFVAAFGPTIQSDPKQSAYVLAGLAMCLDFDEVAYSGHLSASCVNTAIAYGLELGLDGKALLTAIVAANECAARFQASILLGPFFQGQSGTHLHLVGAVAARLHAQGAPEEQWVTTLGLALGILPMPNHHALLDGDAKAFIAASPVRAALDACDAAASGFRGSVTILDGPAGVLAQLSSIPMPDAVTAGLGQRWHTDTLSFKRFPGSAYLQAAFECAERLHRRFGAVDSAQVRSVVVHGSLLTSLLAKKVDPFINYQQPTVSSTTFCIGYGLATLLLTGTLRAQDFVEPVLTDDVRWTLAKKVRVVHDPALTKEMVRATAPLGEALRQAGGRSFNWTELVTWKGGRLARLYRHPLGRKVVQRLVIRRLRAQLAELGPPASTFDEATMSIGARIEVQFFDGTTLKEQCMTATGMAGELTRRNHAAIVRDKFLGVGGSDSAVSDLERIDAMDPIRTRQALTVALTPTDHMSRPSKGLSA